MRAGYYRHAEQAWIEPPVDIWSLKCFAQVADRGSITHAANDLDITQPALTRRVRHLEAELGVTLLERRPRGIRLTGHGRDLLEHARRILREVALAEAHVKHATRAGVRGRVVLGTSPTLAPLLFPGCVARARAECPGVTLRVLEAFSAQLLDDLLSGKVDVAVLTSPPHARSIAMSPLLAEPIVVIGRATERGARRSYSLIELRRTPVIVTSAIRVLVDRQLARHGAQLAVEAEIDSVEAIHRMVLTGDAITVLPVSTFHDDLVRRRCASYAVDEANLHRMLVLAYPAAQQEAPAVGEVIRLVRTEMDRLTRSEIFTLPAAATRQTRSRSPANNQRKSV